MINYSIQLQLNEKFFTKKCSRHILILHPDYDVTVEDVQKTLKGENLDNVIIENVYYPNHTHNVVKLSEV